jgi:hypothetical protein
MRLHPMSWLRIAERLPLRSFIALIHLQTEGLYKMDYFLRCPIQF